MPCSAPKAICCPCYGPVTAPSPQCHVPVTASRFCPVCLNFRFPIPLPSALCHGPAVPPWPCCDPELALSSSLSLVPFPVPCPASAAPEIDHWCPMAIRSLYSTSLLSPDLCKMGGQHLLKRGGNGAAVRALRVLKPVTAPAQPPLGPLPTPAHGPGPRFSPSMITESWPEKCYRCAFFQPCHLDGPFGPPL